MHYEQVFDLLTNEYSLMLVTNTEAFEAVKNIRKEVFAPKYDISSDLLESKGYLFSKDDEQSFIYLLRHNASNTYVGTARVFFVNNQTPIKKLPMEKDGNVTNIDHLTNVLPTIEISRFALIQKLPPHPTYSGLKLRTMLTYGLMVSTRINLFLYHCTNVFSIMELPLHYILKKQKVNFEQIGEEVDYYGMCIPFAIKRKKLLQDTEETMGKITKYYLKQLCQNPEPFWQFIDNNPYLERSDIHLDEICELFKTYGDDADLTLLFDAKKSTSQPTMA